MKIKSSQVQKLFADARERYWIKQRREAHLPRPWTTDPLMSQYHLCNVFRDDDAVSRYVMGRFLPRYRGQEWKAVVLARLVNSETALEQLEKGASLEQVTINTSAYKINTPLGLNNKEGIRVLCERATRKNWMPVQTLEEAHRELTSIGLSAFIAYQATHDLKGSALPRNPSDEDTWTYMGVGAVRGAFRLCGGQPADVEAWITEVGMAKSGANMREQAMKDRHIMAYLRRSLGIRDPLVGALTVAGQVLQMSRDPDLWPSVWPVWHLGEAEHMLCEFDKLERWRQIGPAGARRFK